MPTYQLDDTTVFVSKNPTITAFVEDIYKPNKLHFSYDTSTQFYDHLALNIQYFNWEIFHT